jgi:hypothetical protein
MVKYFFNIMNKANISRWTGHAYLHGSALLPFQSIPILDGLGQRGVMLPPNVIPSSESGRRLHGSGTFP